MPNCVKSPNNGKNKRMAKNRIAILTLCFCMFSSLTFSQENDTISHYSDSAKKVNVAGLVTVGAVTPMALAGVYVYMHHAWWSESSSGFHFDDGKDLEYARNLDKLGHFTASYLASTAFSDILRLTHVPENWALFGGAGLSVLNATIIEIKDGFAPFWGFSVYDEMANVLGAFYPVLQAKVPFFQHIQFRWSYDWNYSYETEYYRYKVAKGSSSEYFFIDDYDRQYFWMTVDWAGLFCKKQPSYKFPYCVDFAIALSGNNLKTLDANKKEELELYVGFDINLTKLFRKKQVGYYICKYLNFYHLPMPALQVAPRGKGYWVLY